MKRKIGLKELYQMASQMKWYQFESWIAKELYDIPHTVDVSGLIKDLYLSERLLDNK